MIEMTVSHYKILAKLGEGGMGIVYKARDTMLKRLVAIKFLPRQIAASEQERERFKIEAQAAAALNHPNIATIHTIEEIGADMFIVMEFIEGKELRQIVGADGGPPLPIDQIINLAAQIASGLKAAHAKGITHRDIKSSNIMVTESSQVKIMDFGLARLGGRTRITKAGTTLGTVAYMSFEQASGKEADHRTDIWSLGVVIYEMLTGQLPFKGQVDQVVIYSILNKEPEPITALRTEAPLELERIVNKALAKDLDERYQRVVELLADLQRLKPMLESGKDEALPTKSRLRRHRRFWGAAAALLLILLIVGGLYLFTSRSETIDSIAVLPLENLSGGSEQDYFVEGMQEALITNLSQFKALRVISRTSTMRYKEPKKSLPEIARELDVDALVEGSVLKVGNRVRISAQLIYGPTDKHLWAKSYDRDLKNVLALLSEVARAIAGEIEITLARQEEEGLLTVRPVNIEAHGAYLRGRYFLNRFDFRKSLDFFQQATSIDPSFAPGYAGQSAAFFGLGFFGLRSHQQLFPQAWTAALKALEMDEGIAEAHAVLGLIKLYNDWDWSAAEKELRRAIVLNPSDVFVRHGYADYLMVMGRLEESLTQVKLGRRYDPLSPMAVGTVIGHLFSTRRYDEVIDECKKTLELDPKNLDPTLASLYFLAVHSFLRKALWQKGMYKDALADYKEAWGRDRELAQALDRGFAESGPKGAVSALARALAARAQAKPVSPLTLAALYAQVGETNATLQYLGEAYEQRLPQILHIKADPEYDYLRSDPRFQDLLRRIGVPENPTLSQK